MGVRGKHSGKSLALLVALTLAGSVVVRSAELKSPTIAAFERYERSAESTIESEVSSPDRFLHVFIGSAEDRAKADRLLRSGQVAIARLRATENGRRIEIPDGLIHHWIGSIFVPDVNLQTAVSVL